MINPYLNWAKRVSRGKIRKLYESDAVGMINTELLDDVGFGFYARLSNMFEIDQASRGRVKCRKCGEIILRKKGTLSKEGRLYKGKDELLKCLQCDWKIIWGEYFESYSGKSLLPNKAESFFSEFLYKWPFLKNPKEKMMLIDWMIHKFHLQYKDEIPVKPTAVNLIEGSSKQIIVLINSLAYGNKSIADINSKSSWKNQ